MGVNTAHPSKSQGLKQKSSSSPSPAMEVPPCDTCRRVKQVASFDSSFLPFGSVRTCSSYGESCCRAKMLICIRSAQPPRAVKMFGCSFGLKL